MITQLGRTCLAALCVCVFVSAPVATQSDQHERIQAVVDELKTQLDIPQTVNVTIVPANPRLFSVAPSAQTHGTFLLSVEEDFARALNDAELKAAVAHELGHVWIYTHFPFLQTEELANDIAARVIGRDSMAPLYAKVWDRVAAH